MGVGESTYSVVPFPTPKLPKLPHLNSIPHVGEQAGFGLKDGVSAGFVHGRSKTFCHVSTLYGWPASPRFIAVLISSFT